MHETLTRLWFNVGPASQMVGNIESPPAQRLVYVGSAVENALLFKHFTVNIFANMPITYRLQ